MDRERTKTAENLQKALEGESVVRNKYTYFAQVAREAGDDEAADAFEQMANNEMMHAKFWFEHLYGGPTDVKACLREAAQGEHGEWHDMYPEFAREAREEGLEDLAVTFEKVAAIERSHENRCLVLLARMDETAEGTSDKRPVQKRRGYRCIFCGAVSPRQLDACQTCGAVGALEQVEYYE